MCNCSENHNHKIGDIHGEVVITTSIEYQAALDELDILWDKLDLIEDSEKIPEDLEKRFDALVLGVAIYESVEFDSIENLRSHDEIDWGIDEGSEVDGEYTKEE